MYNFCMTLLNDRERRVLSAISNLAYCNPFLSERTEHERVALGRDFVPGGAVWNASVNNPDAINPNVPRLHARLESLMNQVHSRITKSSEVHPQDLAIYEDCVQYLLYQRYYPEFVKTAEQASFYTRFLTDWNHYFRIAGKSFETSLQPAHFFACFRQVQRAFHHIFDNIIGNSMPAARLRASVWQSVFTHDLRRYRRVLYARMHDFPTLITGPSGTGKELVARAIAGSRYIAFDPAGCASPILRAIRSRPSISPRSLRLSLNPSCSATNAEHSRARSETGKDGSTHVLPRALSFSTNSARWISRFRSNCCVSSKPVSSSAVGDTAAREFFGKLIAATNRDLHSEIGKARFREDLYYRLCADLVQTPSLSEQIGDSPQVLHDLLLFMVRRAVGDEAASCLPEVEVLAAL